MSSPENHITLFALRREDTRLCIIYSLDKTKLSCSTLNQSSNSVSLETYSLHSLFDYPVCIRVACLCAIISIAYQITFVVTTVTNLPSLRCVITCANYLTQSLRFSKQNVNEVVCLTDATVLRGSCLAQKYLCPDSFKPHCIYLGRIFQNVSNKKIGLPKFTRETHIFKPIRAHLIRFRFFLGQ